MMQRTLDCTGRSALHEAIAYNASPDAIRELLDEGENLNARDNFGNTPLHLASEKLNQKVIELLLIWSPKSVNSLNSDGNTPLHVVAMAGWEQCSQRARRARLR